MPADFSSAHRAVESGDLDALGMLLDAGADVHDEHDGLSLLHHALDLAFHSDEEYGEAEIELVAFLLARGADPTRRSGGGTGVSAEHVAFVAGADRILEMFAAWKRERGI
ncbi:ankyrin repeat domain-containing protein [Streptomyces sp. DSM 44917]|uniref:Ankyrin repeat domain-containing protein n=1 Tax=Streptomyces boetiae TaxID=3075541 RepID=A0ABU2L8T4_9ACTN|nr:ankyrin repeat domain-containing protein [Streptomyces sp. DSM 44917]MDT0307984.1 ankyrin repeat domain-containing protein [Streptomyces sp. DSM 44917]